MLFNYMAEPVHDKKCILISSLGSLNVAIRIVNMDYSRIDLSELYFQKNVNKNNVK